MKKVKTDKHIDEVTIGEVKDLIKKADSEGWESDDGFLLAVSLEYTSHKYKEAYHRLMMEFNELPEEIKESLNKDLNKLGL